MGWPCIRRNHPKPSDSLTGWDSTPSGPPADARFSSRFPRTVRKNGASFFTPRSRPLFSSQDPRRRLSQCVPNYKKLPVTKGSKLLVTSRKKLLSRAPVVPPQKVFGPSKLTPVPPSKRRSDWSPNGTSSSWHYYYTQCIPGKPLSKEPGIRNVELVLVEHWDSQRHRGNCLDVLGIGTRGRYNRHGTSRRTGLFFRPSPSPSPCVATHPRH